MFSDEDRKAIVRFVFGRNENIELALGVLAAGQAIRERIIREFLGKLEDELWRRVKELGKSWKVENKLVADPFERWSMVCVTKAEWERLYSIGLWPQKWQARGFVLGVASDWQKLGLGFDRGLVRQALEGRVPSGKSDDWCPFCTSADPYGDWDDPETLSRLHGDAASQAVGYFADTMVTMVTATENIIDELVRDWRERQQKE